MRRIEIVGPSGVGKSYLARRLARLKRPPGTLLLQDDLHAVRRPGGAAVLRLLRTVGLHGASSMFSRAVALRYRRPMLADDLGRLDGPVWEGALRAGMSAFAQGGRKPASEMLRLTLFLESLAQAHWVESGPGDCVVLFDEGLCQRVVSYAQLYPEDAGTLERLAAAMPPPAGILFVDDDDSTIRRRIIGRNGANSAFEGAIADSRLAVASLRKQASSLAVPALDVDAADSGSPGLSAIAEFVQRVGRPE